MSRKKKPKQQGQTNQVDQETYRRTVIKSICTGYWTSSGPMKLLITKVILNGKYLEMELDTGTTAPYHQGDFPPDP